MVRRSSDLSGYSNENINDLPLQAVQEQAKCPCLLHNQEKFNAINHMPEN